MPRPVRYPANGAWPALMREDMAAAYVDDPSTDVFLANVKAGRYPPAAVVVSQRNRKWAAEDLRHLCPKLDGQHDEEHPALEDDL